MGVGYGETDEKISEKQHKDSAKKLKKQKRLS
jgi:hypothetical protein